MMLKTGRENLYLRKYRLQDIPLYAEFASNPEICRYMRDDFPHPCTPERAEAYILGAMGGHKTTHFAIDFQGGFAGDIHLQPQTDILRHSALLGYWLAEPFWGCGIMTEAVKTITQYGFLVLGLKRIVARVLADNVASVKVLEKAGFIREGYFKRAVIKHGEYLDQAQYARDIFQE